MSRESILYWVHVVAHRTDALLSDVLIELSPQDFAIYSLLKIRGPLTPGQISRRHGMPASSVSAAIQRAEAAGHAERAAHPSDSRTFLIGLTREGEEAHLMALKQFRTVLGPLLEDLAPDTSTVRWSLRRLADSLGALSGLEPEDRPPEEHRGRQTLEYHGAPLTPDETTEVRDHIEYLRWRRDR